MGLHPREARRLADEFALDARAPWLSQPFGAHADGFFRDGLGADVLDVLDASDYEGATLVYNLNDPLYQFSPELMFRVFDAQSGFALHRQRLASTLRNRRHYRRAA